MFPDNLLYNCNNFCLIFRPEQRDFLDDPLDSQQRPLQSRKLHLLLFNL